MTYGKRKISFNSTLKQRGIALLMFGAILALVGTSLIIYQLDTRRLSIERNIKTANALKVAKEAIIGWSINSKNPGQLPCPEDTNKIGLATEGEAQTSCTSNAVSIGRLPWKTLKVGDLRDGDGEKLWYALSPGFRNSPINSLNSGMIKVNGTNDIVAIIFAPGLAINGQTRTIPSSSLPPDVREYLEPENSDADFDFLSSPKSNNFNDSLLTISRTELFKVISPKILADIRGDLSQGLIDFYDQSSPDTSTRYYPYADSNDVDTSADITLLNGTPSVDGYPDSLYFDATTKNMLIQNNWLPLISYQLDPSLKKVTLQLGSKTMEIEP